MKGVIALIRLNTVIADLDENYVNRLSNFLIDHHGSKFQVHSFTKREFFKEFVEKNVDNIDVVLVTTDLYFEELEEMGVNLVCILSDGKLPREYKNVEILDKFQLAQSLVNNIIKTYTEKTDVIITTKGTKETKTIAIYSPLSGSGKTTIALGLSQKMVSAGKKVFYLNFEDNASTNMFFDTTGSSDLSHILFYLKAKVKNLAVKIDVTKKEDVNTGIHYFNPLKSNLELEEITSNEYSLLLNELKNLSSYDYVVVDLPSSFNEKVADILNQVDSVILTIANDLMLKAKTESVIKDFELIYERKRINLYNKLHIVQNKAKASNSLEGIFSIGRVGVDNSIPFCDGLYFKNGEKYSLNLTGQFSTSLDALVKKIE